MDKKQILIHFKGGIGDMIMATQFVNSLLESGHDVDIYTQKTTYDLEQLFRDWPKVRSLSSDPEKFKSIKYDYYLLTMWVTEPLTSENLKDTIILQPSLNGALFNVCPIPEVLLNYAKAIDPDLKISYKLYCNKSNRKFSEISRKTVVIAPGCTREHVMKKWDKFDTLSQHFSDAAVVGMENDLYVGNSYSYPRFISMTLGNFLSHNGKAKKIANIFGRPYSHNQRFSSSVKDYIGRLSLIDTAALISQAGIFIGNDTGLAYIAAAFGIPTFIIFGPTNPRIVQISKSSIKVISQKLDCQPCAFGVGKYPTAWKYNYIGCPVGMRCMVDLTVDDVLGQMKQILGGSYSEFIKP